MPVLLDVYINFFLTDYNVLQGSLHTTTHTATGPPLVYHTPLNTDTLHRPLSNSNPRSTFVTKFRRMYAIALKAMHQLRLNLKFDGSISARNNPVRAQPSRFIFLFVTLNLA